MCVYVYFVISLNNQPTDDIYFCVGFYALIVIKKIVD